MRMKRIYEATEQVKGTTQFTAEQLAEIIGIPQKQLSFLTPSGKPVCIYKVEIYGDAVFFHAYN